MKRQVRRVVDPPCIRRSTVEHMPHPTTIMMLIAALGLTVHTGCVRRTLTIETDPQGAIVTLNDEEIGATPVSRDFLWYGDYDVLIRKEGYETLSTHWLIPRPWYAIPPIDFFVESLWPGWIHDAHFKEFVLTPTSPPDAQALFDRAMQTRRQALDKKERKERGHH